MSGRDVANPQQSWLWRPGWWLPLLRRHCGAARRAERPRGRIHLSGVIVDKEFDHPIVDRPWEYSIGSVHYHVGLDGTEPHIDVTLHRGETVRRLRFLSPRQLEMSDDLPQAPHAMVILDVRQRGLEGLNVEVTDFEAHGGRLRFWARTVIDLDALGH